jgi:group I intron endonuclease
MNRLERELARGESRIYSAIVKYGIEAFSFEVLEIFTPESTSTAVENAKAILVIEDSYIKEFEPAYNIIRRNTSTGMSGRTISAEAKIKISTAKRTEEARARVSAQFKGRVHTEESRSLISKNSRMKKPVYKYSNDSITLVNKYESITDCCTETGINRDRLKRGITKGSLINGFYFSQVEK